MTLTFPPADKTSTSSKSGAPGGARGVLEGVLRLQALRGSGGQGHRRAERLLQLRGLRAGLLWEICIELDEH